MKIDLELIIIINFIPFLCTLLLPISKVSKLFDYLVFVSFNIPFIILSVIDIAYFKFIGQRISTSVLDFKIDIKDQFLNLIYFYWGFSLIILLIFIVFITFVPKLENKNIRLYKVIIILLIFSSSLIKSYVEYPASYNNILNYISTNTPLSIISSVQIDKPKNVRLIENSELFKYINRDISNHNFSHSSKQNIFIIICESLSNECLLNGKTNFLDSLSSKGIFFNNFYSNGKESVDAVPAIISSIPKLEDNHFIQYINGDIHPQSIASVLTPIGYNTMFFHGARNRSMGFKKYTKICGYNKYFGMDDYPNFKNDFDGAWGIYDDYFLSFACKKISEVKQPFHGVFFTLSSHNPFKIPKHFQLKEDEKNDMHTSIRYADYSIMKFFEEAKRTKWYQNTLFIITGDHTHLQIQEGRKAYNVPLILFHPNGDELSQLRSKINSFKISQHVDIMPTVLDYLNIKQKNTLPFGESIFSKNNGTAFFYHSGVYNLVSSTGDVSFSIEKKVKNSSLNENDITRLKSFVQFYNNFFIKDYVH